MFIVRFSSVLVMSWWPKSKHIKQLVLRRYTTLAPLPLTSRPAKHVVSMNTASGQLYFKAGQQWPIISIVATRVAVKSRNMNPWERNWISWKSCIFPSELAFQVFCLLSEGGCCLRWGKQPCTTNLPNMEPLWRISFVTVLAFVKKKKGSHAAHDNGG